MSYSYQEAPEPKSYVGTWIATALLILAYVFGLLIFPPLFEAPKEEASKMVLFVGRFHPILLHLPVGALIVLVFMELACLRRSGEAALGSAALLTLWIGAAGSVLAGMAGIMLSREGGYEGGNFTLHQTMALIGTAGILLALVLRLTAMGRGSSEALHVYRAVFFLSFSIMGLGAHFGGNMSHGNKFLTEHAPDGIRQPMVNMEKWMLSFVEKPKAEAEPTPAVAGTLKQPSAPPIKEETKKPATTSTVLAPEPIKPAGNASMTPSGPASAGTPVPAPVNPTAAAGGDKLMFQHVILPIFEAKCNKCHNEDKSKGDLRLDNYEMAMKGGENSANTNLVAGKPDESVTIQRILLDESDDEHMPPEGKPQLTAEELGILRWWISNGASATLKVSDAKIPAELQGVVDSTLKSVVQNQP